MRTAVLRVSIAVLATALCWSTAALSSGREQAVALARQGLLDQAVVELERLYRETPDDPAILFDLIAVSNWAGRDARVVELAAAVDAGSAPAFALRAMGQSARRTGRAPLSLAAYQQLVGRKDSIADDYQGLSLSLSDAGQPGQGQSVARAASARFGVSAPLLFADAYAEFADQRWAHALAGARRALQIDPRHTDSARLLTGALQRLGATAPAARFSSAYPGGLPEADRYRVAADRNATWVRWGALDQGPGTSRFRDADIAIARLEALLAEIAADPDYPEASRRVAEFDLMVALRDRVRMRDVIDRYQALTGRGVELPAYARQAAADAWLYLREPERAAALYQSVIDESARLVDAHIGLFYALLESEDYSSARSVISKLAESLPARTVSGNGRVIAPNYDWLSVSITAAMMDAYSDRLDVAQERLESIRGKAPHNAALYRELSNVYRWRGWAGPALEQARIGRTAFPEDSGLRVAEVTSLLDLGRIEEGEELAQPLFAAFSDSTAVQALQRRLQAFHAPRLDGYFSRARSSAANVVSGELSYAYGIEIASAPIDYRSRVFAAVDRRTSTFADAVLRHTRSAVGYRYRYGGVGLHIALTDSQGDIDDTGYRAGFELSAGERASFGVDYESVSLETPLRAGLTGTTADRLDLAAAYRWHESRFLRLNLGRMDFTDGNRRDYGGINWEERWVAGPVYRLYSFLGAYRSSNSLPGVDYFNPTRDRTLGLTVRNRWKTWRRYERAFHQVLDLSVGRYDQQGFVVGDTWGMRYEHTFEREDEYLLSYGVRRSRDFYDGKPEYVNEIFLRYSRIF